MLRRSVIVLAPFVLLAACGSEEEAPKPEDDPAMTSALQDRIMVDPDLVGQNRANAAALLPDGDGSIPVEDSSPEAIAAARSDALTLVGGPGRMKKAPDARQVSASLPAGATLTAAARAAASPGGGENCAEIATYTASWAAKMPEAFPVYPRGAVQEAAGSDAGNCRLRVVNFLTPVPLGEVVDFYFTRASSAGFTVDRALIDGEDTIGGSKGGSSFVVYARAQSNGLTSVDLVTNGG
ncbi:hypothetical protein GRI89_02130 [Altererythrobacter salegens]|uniref:Lipoprotein n=1 Tax=Croceibacterium salegens TaxID=1737568 RepID=A0A6I4SR61_9SPHN|nr:hypothetical protein [Croceibacterium salegens]MXO58343.1 hypothetical protein [Croceibacterium salegens]